MSTKDLDNRHSKYELKALLDTTRLLIESHDLPFIVNNLLLNLMGKLMITKAAIFLDVTGDNTAFSIYRFKGRTSIEPNFSTTWKPADSLTIESIHTYEPTTVDDSFPKSFLDDHFCHFVDLKTSNQYLGYLAFGNKLTGTKFTKRDFDFITTLSIISSVAIANSQLFNDLRDTNRELDLKVQELHTLFDLSKEFNTSVDRDQILRIFKFALLGQMFIRSFFLIYKNRDKESPELLLNHGSKSEIPQQVINEIYESINEDIVIDDKVKEAVPSLNDYQISVLIPLSLQQEKNAVLALGNRANQKSITPSDFNFLYSLGNLLLLSIQKTYLLEERIEKERIEKELHIARDIQQRLQPENIPEIENISLAAKNQPSREVGGDYFDIIPCENKRYYLAIADVTGKGIPASLIMANLQAMIHILTTTDLSLVKKTGQINDIIYNNTPPDIFITFFWGYVDVETMNFHYVNAGHNPPLLLRDDTFIELSKGGLILGALQTMMPYQSDTIHLQSDDIIVFYTDGVTEAMNNDEEEFEDKGLKNVIKSYKHLSADEILLAITEAVNQFCDFQLNDDLTLIVMKVN